MQSFEIVFESQQKKMHLLRIESESAILIATEKVIKTCYTHLL